MSRSLLLMLVILTCYCWPSVQGAPPDKSTRRALDETTQVNFEQTPLAEAMQSLSQRHKVSIAIDDDALADIGIPTDAPLSLSIDGITLRSVLSLLLEGLGLVAVPVGGGGLQVTTREIADEQLDKRPYDLRPLSGLVAPDPQKVIDVVQSCTDGNWVEIDGIGGTLHLEGSALVVEQTNQVHDQVAQVLARITRIVNPRLAPPLTPQEKHEQALYRAVQQKPGVDVDFADMPLQAAIESLAEQAKVSIVVDEVSLADVGVPTDEPISLQVKNVSLSNALEQLLKPLNLDWQIDNEVILVTTSEVSAEQLQAVAFDVRRQIRAAGGPAQLLSRLQQLDGTGSWEMIDGYGGRAEMLGGVLVVFHNRGALEAIAASLK